MKKNNTYSLNIQTKGFTLLEMLFAVIIFSFALISLMGIASKGVIATTTARDQLTAQYLAEEGLEVVRNLRDSNFLGFSSDTPWLTNIDQCSETSPCYVEYSTVSGQPTLALCSGECGPLSEVDGVFRPSGSGVSGTITPFSREIYVVDDGLPPNQRKVVATVRWNQKTLKRSFSVSTYISDWQRVTP